MTLPQFSNLRSLKYVLTLALVTLLAACGGDGGLAESGSNVGVSNDDILSLNIMGVSWTAPSEREDGSPLSLSEISSFHIYYGTEAGDYQNQIDIDDPSAASAQVEELPSGTYYLVVTAIDTDGRESLYTPEIVINL